MPQALIDAEATVKIGAAPHERAPPRPAICLPLGACPAGALTFESDLYQAQAIRRISSRLVVARLEDIKFLIHNTIAHMRTVSRREKHADGSENLDAISGLPAITFFPLPFPSIEPLISDVHVSSVPQGDIESSDPVWCSDQLVVADFVQPATRLVLNLVADTRHVPSAPTVDSCGFFCSRVAVCCYGFSRRLRRRPFSRRSSRGF